MLLESSLFLEHSCSLILCSKDGPSMKISNGIEGDKQGVEYSTKCNNINESAYPSKR